MANDDNQVNTAKRPKTEQEKLIERLELESIKEEGDVISSINSIRDTMEGIFMKEDKVKRASSPGLARQYKKQVKKSKQYLDDLFKTLKDEMLEAEALRVSIKIAQRK